VFFASVGLSINIFLAADQAMFIVWLTAGIIALKLASSMATLKLFRYTHDQSLKISSGFVTLSEMTIVIAALAVSKLSPVVYISIIASFLVINTLSPFIMNMAFSERRGFLRRM